MGFFESVGYVLQQNWSSFLLGVFYTLLISLVSTLIGLLIGIVVGVVRTIPLSKKKFPRVMQKITNGILATYIEVFRGTPMMVQSMVIYWGYAFATGGKTLNLMFAAMFIVSINTGAYIAEIVRGGINSIDKGQFEGAHAVGMGHFKTMTYVVIPQVIKNILPAVSNEFIINIKDTSVLNVIGVTELYFFMNLTVRETGKNFPVYFIVCIIYLIMTFSISRIIKFIEKKMSAKKDFVLIEEQTEKTIEEQKEVKKA